MVGRVLSSMDLRRSHIAVFVFKQKTAQPEPNQARRLNKKRSGLVHIFVNLYPVIVIVFAVGALQKIRTLINTHFQSRKVHENLVGTQPAR